MKKRNRLIVGIIALLMLACACPISSLPTSSDQPPQSEQPTNPPLIYSTSAAPTSEPPPAPNGNVLFSDDFSVDSAEMESYSDEFGRVGTRDGVYVVRTTGDKWQWGKSESEFADTVIEVDAFVAIGPSNDNAGVAVICRLTIRPDESVDGYLFGISPDGYYTIRSITSSSMSPLVDWTFTDAVKLGAQTNQMRATCNGNDLSLEVNGELVGTARTIPDGSTFGSVAFAAISFEDIETLVEAHFDNLVVSRP
jgi:hypothetical protein